MQVLVSNPAVALTNLKELVIDPAIGLFRFVSRRHHEPKAPTETLQNGDVSIIWADGGRITYPAKIMELSRSTTIRSEMANVVRPLESDGCDEVILVSSSTESISIVRDDLPAFQVTPTVDAPIEEQTVPMTLVVAAPSFDRKKWRVSDGQATFWVAILDEGFQRQIEVGEQRFGNGDYLRCEVRFRQFETDSGLRMERDVLRVIEHRRRPPSPPSLFDESSQ